MNKQLSNKILERIDADQITSLPHWRFLLLRGCFWLLAGLSIAIGSIAIGVILFLLEDHRRHGFFEVSHDMTELLLIVPFLWIVIFALFIAIAHINVKHTRQGYKYHLHSILFLSIIFSIFFGLLFNFIGIGKTTHEFLNKISIYNSVIYDSKNAWDHPAIGRLAGVIVSIQGRDFSLKDFNGHVWRVRPVVSMNGSFMPEVNSTVRMLGSLESSSNIFIANFIHKWEP